MTTMYGLGIDLPPNWLDITEYLFEAEGLLPQLAFTREPLAPRDVDRWLEEIREGVGALGMQAGPIVDYANPTLEIRGFTAAVDDGTERAGTAFIVVSFPTHAVILQPKWLDGGEPLIVELVRSLRVAGATSAFVTPPGFRYSVYDLFFDSSLRFAPPRSFAFQSADERGRIWCSGRPSGTPFEPPIWAMRFDFDPLCVLSSASDSARRIVSPRVLPPELEGPSFEQKHWMITASDALAGSRQLTWAEAWTWVNGASFRIWFAYEGNGAEAIAIWESVLTSARRD